MHSTQKKLITQILEQTNSQAVKWSVTSSNDKYELQLKPYRFTIYMPVRTMPLAPWDDNVIIEFSFIDGKGDVFDSVKVYVAGSEDYTLLSELFTSARRNALDIDNKLSEISNLLDKNANNQN